MCPTDTFIDWWNAGNIQLYTSPGGSVQTPAPQPASLTNALKDPNQLLIPNPTVTGTVLPTCVGVQSKVSGSPAAITCEPLSIYRVAGTLQKNDGSQLLEYTLGARNENVPPRTGDYVAYWLDTHNVDFDVSYVNVAWTPAAMGVFGNDQVGYTGTPQTIDDFKLGTAHDGSGGLTAFKSATASKGWPQFYNTYPNINIPPAHDCENPVSTFFACFTFLKFPSLLEIFTRLSGANPPTDLVPAISPDDWKKGPPDSLASWPPIKALYTSWTTSAGKVTVATNPPYYATTTGNCTGTYLPGQQINDWCTAIVAARTILLANYTKYRELFNNSKCSGTPVNINDGALVSHL
jgi:hypothetical protein